jgi:hypothetical protein
VVAHLNICYAVLQYLLRVILLAQLGAGNAKGSRTHYLAESGVHWSLGQSARTFFI